MTAIKLDCSYVKGKVYLGFTFNIQMQLQSLLPEWNNPIIHHALILGIANLGLISSLQAGWWRLGVALASMNLKGEAKRAFETALSLEPRCDTSGHRESAFLSSPSNGSPYHQQHSLEVLLVCSGQIQNPACLTWYTIALFTWIRLDHICGAGMRSCKASCALLRAIPAPLLPAAQQVCVSSLAQEQWASTICWRSRGAKPMCSPLLVIESVRHRKGQACCHACGDLLG